MAHVSDRAEKGKRLAQMAERIRAPAERSSITWWGDRTGITVSVGGCLVRAGDDVASLEARAGQLLEGAQQEGGNPASMTRPSRMPTAGWKVHPTP